MEWSGIAVFYFGCLSLGFLFALVGAFFGEFLGRGDVDAGGHEIDIGHDVDAGGVGHEMDLGHDAAAAHAGEAGSASILNSITISTFVAFFGLAGLVAVWGFGLGGVPSLAFALPVAMITAAAQFYLYVKLLVKAQASSEATMFDILGCQAEVITAIPADRVGEIAYVIKGTRYSAPAASADNEDIPRGTRVQVVNIRGATLVVRPM